MSDPEILRESNPQYSVEIATYGSFSLSTIWEPSGFYETLDEAKEEAKRLSRDYSNVRVIKYGKD